VVSSRHPSGREEQLWVTGELFFLLVSFYFPFINFVWAYIQDGSVRFGCGGVISCIKAHFHIHFEGIELVGLKFKKYLHQKQALFFLHNLLNLIS
jgi:hypothetical protein